MPLTINLLHEEQFRRKQSKRDPLKLGLYALAGVAALFVLYYLVRLAGSSTVMNDMRAHEADWAKQQPLAAAAAKRETETDRADRRRQLDHQPHREPFSTGRRSSSC